MPQKYQPSMSAQAQKFGIFEKSSLWMSQYIFVWEYKYWKCITVYFNQKSQITALWKSVNSFLEEKKNQDSQFQDLVFDLMKKLFIFLSFLSYKMKIWIKIIFFTGQRGQLIMSQKFGYIDISHSTLICLFYLFLLHPCMWVQTCARTA